MRKRNRELLTPFCQSTLSALLLYVVYVQPRKAQKVVEAPRGRIPLSAIHAIRQVIYYIILIKEIESINFSLMCTVNLMIHINFLSSDYDLCSEYCHDLIKPFRDTYSHSFNPSYSLGQTLIYLAKSHYNCKEAITTAYLRLINNLK